MAARLRPRAGEREAALGRHASAQRTRWKGRSRSASRRTMPVLCPEMSALLLDASFHANTVGGNSGTAFWNHSSTCLPRMLTGRGLAESPEISTDRPSGRHSPSSRLTRLTAGPMADRWPGRPASAAKSSISPVRTVSGLGRGCKAKPTPKDSGRAATGRPHPPRPAFGLAGEGAGARPYPAAAGAVGNSVYPKASKATTIHKRRTATRTC
jgi:hypothetical protein